MGTKVFLVADENKMKAAGNSIETLNQNNIPTNLNLRCRACRAG